MALSIIQRPTNFQPSQSPVVFAVSESGAFVTASNFQYTAQLTIWPAGNATLENNTSSYAIRKYPNQAGVGLFDFSKWLNAFGSERLPGLRNGFMFYKAAFGWQYESGSSYVTSSLTTISSSEYGNPLAAYEGYSIWGEEDVNQNYYNNTTHAVFATDMYTVTQSFLRTDGTFGINDELGCPWYEFKMDLASYPNSVVTSASYEDGTSRSKVTAVAPVGYTGSPNIIFQDGIAVAPAAANFPVYFHTASLSGSPISKYSATFISGSSGTSGVGVQIGPKFHFEIVCEQYYTPVRIGWINRYNRLDYMNFYKRNDQTFTTEERLYRPDLPQWNDRTLYLQPWNTSQQRYITDANQTLIVNTGWLEQGYNDIIKQLLVADQIDWLFDPIDQIVTGSLNPFTGSVVLNSSNSIPLTIKTSNVEFKTHVNNKLIQYTIEFNIGQPYKFIF